MNLCSCSMLEGFDLGLKNDSYHFKQPVSRSPCSINQLEVKTCPIPDDLIHQGYEMNSVNIYASNHSPTLQPNLGTMASNPSNEAPQVVPFDDAFYPIQARKHCLIGGNGRCSSSVNQNSYRISHENRLPVEGNYYQMSYPNETNLVNSVNPKRKYQRTPAITTAQAATTTTMTRTRTRNTRCQSNRQIDNLSIPNSNEISANDYHNFPSGLAFAPRNESVCAEFENAQSKQFHAMINHQTGALPLNLGDRLIPTISIKSINYENPLLTNHNVSGEIGHATQFPHNQCKCDPTAFYVHEYLPSVRIERNQPADKPYPLGFQKQNGIGYENDSIESEFYPDHCSKTSLVQTNSHCAQINDEFAKHMPSRPPPSNAHLMESSNVVCYSDTIRSSPSPGVGPCYSHMSNTPHIIDNNYQRVDETYQVTPFQPSNIELDNLKSQFPAYLSEQNPAARSEHFSTLMNSTMGPIHSNPSSSHKGQIQLWQFLLEELENPDSNRFISWTGQGSNEFKLIEPNQVALRWGARKNKPKMNYEKLSRGLRYYYDKKIIQKVSGKRYVYRFAQRVLDLLRRPISLEDYANVDLVVCDEDRMNGEMWS